MPIASSFVPDIFFILSAAGYGSEAVTLFKGPNADIPEDVPTGFRALISVVPTGGGEEGTHNLSRTVIAYETAEAQIVVRSKDSDLAEAVALELWSDHLNFYDTFVNGTWWRTCTPKQKPFPIAADPKEYARQVFNLSCVKRLSPATS